jgi:6-phosphogluconate dehydrogenase
MEFGIYGLGRMGGNMARRLARQGERIALFNRRHEVAAALAAETGHAAAASIEAFVAALDAPRIVWLMLPAGEATESALGALLPLLQAGDLVVDGGNGFYKDALRRAAWLGERGIDFADAGVSGGVWGLAEGYCIMFGGTEMAAARLAPYLASSTA